MIMALNQFFTYLLYLLKSVNIQRNTLTLTLIADPNPYNNPDPNHSYPDPTNHTEPYSL